MGGPRLAEVRHRARQPFNFEPDFASAAEVKGNMAIIKRDRQQ